MAAKKKKTSAKKKTAANTSLALVEETAKPAKKASAKRGPAKTAPSRGVAFPHVPPDWTTKTSNEHWVPSAETRAEIARLLKAARKDERSKQKATFAKVARMLPKPLMAILGDNSPRWEEVASAEVAAVAMALLRYTTRPDADVDRALGELERILPEVPLVSLNGMVDGPTFVALTTEIDRVARSSHGRHTCLQDYLIHS
jgi:hypothetical protein